MSVGTEVLTDEVGHERLDRHASGAVRAFWAWRRKTTINEDPPWVNVSGQIESDGNFVSSGEEVEA